jgi:hypothetical protein
MTLHLTSFFEGVALTIFVVFFMSTWDQWRALPRIWRSEADCIVAPWLRALRRAVRPVRAERCPACGGDHGLSTDPTWKHDA